MCLTFTPYFRYSSTRCTPWTHKTCNCNYWNWRIFLVCSIFIAGEYGILELCMGHANTNTANIIRINWFEIKISRNYLVVTWMLGHYNPLENCIRNIFPIAMNFCFSQVHLQNVQLLLCWKANGICIVSMQSKWDKKIEKKKQKIREV